LKEPIKNDNLSLFQHFIHIRILISSAELFVFTTVIKCMAKDALMNQIALQKIKYRHQTDSPPNCPKSSS